MPNLDSFNLFEDVEWGTWFSVGASANSFLLIELTVFALAAFMFRDAFRGDRKRKQPSATAGRKRKQPSVTAGSVSSPIEVGTIDYSSGAWPRVSLLVRAFLFTLLLEALISSQTKWHYIAALGTERSPYNYPTDQFLLSLWGVPLWIPIGWAVIFYLVTRTSDRLISSDPTARWPWGRAVVARAFIDGALALTIDFALDPIAQAEGWWTWTPRAYATEFFAIPISNFIAWFAIIFSLSFAIRLGKTGRLAERNDWPRWRTTAHRVVLGSAAFVATFAVVYLLVLGIYLLDSLEWRFNPAMAIGLVIGVGVLVVSFFALPFRRDYEYDAVIVRSAIALHVVFAVSMALNVLSSSESDKTVLVVASSNAESAGAEVEESEGIGGPVTSMTLTVTTESDTVLLDGTLSPGWWKQSESGRGLEFLGFNVSPTGPKGEKLEKIEKTDAKGAYIIIRRGTVPLLTRDPELTIWMPMIAAVSLFLFIWPYWNSVSSRVFSKDRKGPWIRQL